MELSRIDINNFRSIKKATIDFNHNCLILLGKNEAGKSNALKAIAAVFGMYTLKNKDKRKKIDNEKIEFYDITAVLKLNDAEIDKVEQRFISKYSGLGNISFANKKNLKNYIQTVFKEFLITIDVADNSKPSYSYWIYTKKDFELLNPLFLNGSEIQNENGVEFDLEGKIFELVEGIYKENPLTCHFWEYNEEYLLPNSIEINAFIQKPSSYKSLENIFTLCNRENIRQEFEESKNQDGDYSNLLEQVSTSVTKIFQNIWDDFKDTSIQLLPNGNEILVKVVNKTKYSFEERSDGFKKFISILLMISTQSRANKINANDIIIIDEPDQSLYPTSARFLRDELLHIALKSKIVYSTHSQYMIDENCLDRHLIVEKKNDITVIKKEDKNSPFSNDELLRRAIGTSVFECLKSMNIIFEGWLDKELFKIYCKFKKLNKGFENYGTVYLSGISGVETLVQILVLANKKFIIVADSDATSNHKRNDFISNYKEFQNSWIAYADFCPKVLTMEDFFDTDYIKQTIEDCGCAGYTYENSKRAIENIDLAVKGSKEKKQLIKNKLIERISEDKIVPEYDLFIQRIKDALEIR